MIDTNYNNFDDAFNNAIGRVSARGRATAVQRKLKQRWIHDVSLQQQLCMSLNLYVC